MNISVRDGVFESNSSSSHSVAIGRGDVFDKSFDHSSIRNGRIELALEHQYYGEERYRYYKPENIVQYLLATIFVGCPDFDASVEAGDWNAAPYIKQALAEGRELIELVEKLTGCELVLTVKAGDHIWLDYDTEGNAHFDWRNEEKLKSLLFNSGSYVETKSRNESYDDYPEYIDTDMGDELTDQPGEGRRILNENHM